MAQFGIHALIGLWITWSLPSFTPYLIRFSFGAGLYIGCVFPDIDIYASAIAFFLKSSSSSLHRTLTHSIITSTFILFLFLFVEAMVKKRNNNNRREAKLIYDVEADDDSFPDLSGTLSSDERYFGINFKAFGLGLYAGMMIHIMLDIIFWFSPINILFPLPLFGIGHEIDAWQIKNFPYLVSVVLTLSEPLFLSFFFSALRICVSIRLGKWANVPDAVAQQKRPFTDNEHSMDLSLLTDSDICPIDQPTLSRARLSLSLSKFIIIFQLLFFTSMCISSFFPFSKNYLEQLVFGELMLVGIPAYCYLSWMVKDVILRRSN